jgi:predicted dehydrogenase
MTLRFGLLGTGYWAAETQAAALAVHPEASLVGVWGRDPAKAAAVADRYGARGYADLDDLLADVDAVAVALPPDIQAAVALRAAQAGRHLLLDKPVAFAVAQADLLVAEVDRRGLASLVFFTNRFYAEIEAFLATTVATGDWYGARCAMFSSIFQPGNPYGSSPWRKEKGGLWDIGPHALSLILPVLGPVTEVLAADGPYDTVYTILRHAGGATSTMALTLDAPATVTGSEVAFYGPAGYATVPPVDWRPVEAFAAAVSQLVRMAADGTTTHPVDVRFGRDVVAILAAADESRRTHAAARTSQI